MRDDYKPYIERMDKTVDFLSQNLASIRVGRASAAVLDRVTVDYYGSATPIAQMSTISTPDPRTLVIQPWDRSCLKDIEKAILASNIGINPSNDGNVLRLVFPQVSEERRKELTKQVAKYAEESKVAVRNIRRDAMDFFKDQKKKSLVTEDEMKIIEKEIQDLTDKKCKEIEAVEAKKNKELLEV